jgi:LytS/YehU family sensor histidine kinase
VNNKYDNSIKAAVHSSGGIGLNLVRRRLEIIYPDKNTFKITQDNDRFNVELILELDDN